MPRIVITHAVQDVDRWLKGKAERAAALPGATNVTDLVAMDGSNHAAVAFDIDDLDALKASAVLGSSGDGRPGGVTRGHHADDDRLRPGVGRHLARARFRGVNGFRQPGAAGHCGRARARW